ncbi:MAG: hypothetical protein R2710_16550 [Acidimicrobiales bacterium]
MSGMIRIADRAVHPVAVLATVAGAIGLLVAAPRLLLIMLIGAAAIVGVVLAVELAPSSRAIVWNDFRRSSSERQASDRRVQVLKARLGRTFEHRRSPQAVTTPTTTNWATRSCT